MLSGAGRGGGALKKAVGYHAQLVSAAFLLARGNPDVVLEVRREFQTDAAPWTVRYSGTLTSAGLQSVIAAHVRMQRRLNTRPKANGAWSCDGLDCWERNCTGYARPRGTLKKDGVL